MTTPPQIGTTSPGRPDVASVRSRAEGATPSATLSGCHRVEIDEMAERSDHVHAAQHPFHATEERSAVDQHVGVDQGDDRGGGQAVAGIARRRLGERAVRCEVEVLRRTRQCGDRQRVGPVLYDHDIDGQGVEPTKDGDEIRGAMAGIVGSERDDHHAPLVHVVVRRADGGPAASTGVGQRSRVMAGMRTGRTPVIVRSRDLSCS